MDKEKIYLPWLQISNGFQALNDEDEPNLDPVEKQWTSVRITVDSGAAESVWPGGLLPEDTDQAVCGIADWGYIYRSQWEQDAHPRREEGPLQDEGRPELSITFQVTKVKKPLAAVSKITEQGDRVCFGPSEAYIENVATGKRTNLELHNGNYSLDVEYFNEPGFTRLDRR